MNRIVHPPGRMRKRGRLLQAFRQTFKRLAPFRHCDYIGQCVLPGIYQPRGAQNEMNSTPNKAAEPQRKGDFEKSLARLEEVVKRLESTDLSLDEAMKLFEEGVKLSRDCQKQLEEAEGRVEILLKKADGKMAAEPFEPEDESS
jgi:exodeoxyribonuclease VII small subunit